MSYQNKESLPQVTIITRCFNSERTIGRLVDSVLNQKIDSNQYELLILDDGSTDQTLSIVKSYGDCLRLVEPGHLGPYPLLNLGIKETRTSYLVYMDADDWWEPNALICLLDFVSQNPKISIVMSDYYEYDEKLNTTKVVKIKDNLFNSLAGGVLWSTRVFKKTGYYDESLFFPEYDLLIRALNAGFIHHVISNPLFTYRRHQGTLTTNTKAVKKGLKEIYQRHGRNFKIRDY